MSTFNPNVPTGLLKLKIDYKNVQLNFNQLNNTYAVDHVPLTDNTGVVPAGINGAHKVVHLVPFSTLASNPPNNQPIVAPAAVASLGEVFSAQINDGINSDEALYFQSGGGRITQFTRNFQPTISQTGATTLPGGLILNWGYKTSTGGLQTVTLTQKFVGNFYNAQATMNRNVSNVDAIYCVTAPSAAPPGGITTLQFRDTSSGNPFFWWAIGN